MVNMLLTSAWNPRAGDAGTGAAWHPVGGSLVLGDWQPVGAAAIEVCDQQRATVIGEVADVPPAQVTAVIDRVVERSRRAGVPSSLERQAALEGAAERVAASAESFARLLCAEGAKTIREARTEVARCVRTLRLSAGEAARPAGGPVPFEAAAPDGSLRGSWEAVPVGLVAAVTPYNDALNLVAHKLGPAVAAGCPIVLKPSERTPLSALRLAEVLVEAGVPGWMVSVLPGGREAVRALVSHPAVAAVSFTGGWAAGDAVARAAGARKLLMELGASCPVIVLDDADLDDAAARIVAGAFSAAGQNCLSVQRVYASSTAHEPLLDRIAARARQLAWGDKHDERTDMGPLIDQADADRVLALVESAVGRGARRATPAGREGPALAPTVLADVDERDAVMREEVFGPVVSVNAVNDDEEAVARANDSPFGLQAGVFGGDLERASRVARLLRVGGVLINESSDVRVDEMPFGGFGRSGIGREGVRFAMDALSEPRVTATRSLR